MFYTFTSTNRATFEKAFAAGQPVAIAKDPAWARDHETFLGRGFTSATVADPFFDGPSRPGEAWFYWVAERATPVGPVEWGTTDKPWRFYCDQCERWCGANETRESVEVMRAVHVEQHEREPKTWTGLEVIALGVRSKRGVVVDGIPKKSGPNRGKVEVMWIGGSWTVAEDIAELHRVEP